MEIQSESGACCFRAVTERDKCFRPERESEIEKDWRSALLFRQPHLFIILMAWRPRTNVNKEVHCSHNRVRRLLQHGIRNRGLALNRSRVKSESITLNIPRHFNLEHLD